MTRSLQAYLSTQGVAVDGAFRATGPAAPDASATSIVNVTFTQADLDAQK